MKILAINGSARHQGTTTRLARAALDGAASLGLATDMVMLADKDIRFCANCLTCYQDLDARIGRCAIDDDMGPILAQIAEADGILLASPIHNGFVTGLMTTFFERAAWTLCRPTGEIMGLKGTPAPRLVEKTRASASIVSAGLIPPEMRPYCDLATPWLRDMGPTLFNGEFVADLYAAGLTSRPLAANEWQRGLLLRALTEEQLAEALALGVTLAQAVLQGVRPYSPEMHGVAGPG